MKGGHTCFVHSRMSANAIDIRKARTIYGCNMFVSALAPFDKKTQPDKYDDTGSAFVFSMLVRRLL